ncbi:cytochrome C5 [Variovorax beijingensis]|uniref:Cytochrome C5 n=1 Tax=Variovorax beijingensis TaxID=2496117 RepID=A0ABX9ZWM4_9BURK|nr:cytochrome C5 [Variovorax beijingensis]RSZ24363.1 cytochrome C5 [Variovorax beijingensis]
MIHKFREAIASSGVLTDVEVRDDIVVGRARVLAAQADVWVNVDPELEDGEAPDATALLRGIDQILGVSPTQWGLIIDQIVGEVEAAVGDEPVQETTSLRSDLVLKSVVVFAGTTLLRFEAPRQFPDSWIHAQLDEQLALDDLAVDAREVDAETVSFNTVDDLLDHVSEDNTPREP